MRPQFDIGVPGPCLAERTMEVHGGRVVCLNLVGCASGLGGSSGLWDIGVSKMKQG